MFIIDGAKIRNNFVISSTRRQKLTNFNIYNFHDSIATKNPRCRQAPGILYYSLFLRPFGSKRAEPERTFHY